MRERQGPSISNSAYSYKRVKIKRCNTKTTILKFCPRNWSFFFFFWREVKLSHFLILMKEMRKIDESTFLSKALSVQSKSI